MNRSAAWPTGPDHFFPGAADQLLVDLAGLFRFRWPSGRRRWRPWSCALRRQRTSIMPFLSRIFTDVADRLLHVDAGGRRRLRHASGMVTLLVSALTGGLPQFGRRTGRSSCSGRRIGDLVALGGDQREPFTITFLQVCGVPTPAAASARLNWLSADAGFGGVQEPARADSLSDVPSAPIANSTARLCMGAGVALFGRHLVPGLGAWRCRGRCRALS